jgi:hypothetical protein
MSNKPSRLRFIVMSLVLGEELGDFPLERPAAKSTFDILLKIHESKNNVFALNLRLGLGIRFSSVIQFRVRFKFRFCGFAS